MLKLRYFLPYAITMQKSFRLLLISLVLLLALPACASEQPLTLDSLPQYSDDIKAPGESTLADAVLLNLKKTATQQGLTAETRIYGVSNNADFESIQAFYETGLGKTWMPDPALAQEKEGFQTTGWTHGGFYQQAVVIALVDDPFVGQRFLLVVLFN